MSSKSHPKIRPGTLSPLVADIDAIYVFQAHVFHPSGHGIEASGEDDDVELAELPILSYEAVLLDFHDGVVLDVDHVVVRLVDDFVEILLERGALGSPGVRGGRGSENISLAWILYPLAHLLVPELEGFVVGVPVEEHVAVGSEPEFETTCARSVEEIGRELVLGYRSLPLSHSPWKNLSRSSGPSSNVFFSTKVYGKPANVFMRSLKNLA